MSDDQRRRRKDAGKRIQRARRAAGHRSQASFADAIGYHESSVAQAESGSDRAGEGLFQAIETTLLMPPMVISAYIETGDDTLLDRIAYKSAAELEPAQSPPLPTPEYALGNGGQPLNSIRELIRSHGVDKVTAAMIAAVREHDEEAHQRADQPQTHGDEIQ